MSSGIHIHSAQNSSEILKVRMTCVCVLEMHTFTHVDDNVHKYGTSDEICCLKKEESAKAAKREISTTC